MLNTIVFFTEISPFVAVADVAGFICSLLKEKIFETTYICCYIRYNGFVASIASCLRCFSCGSLLFEGSAFSSTAYARVDHRLGIVAIEYLWRADVSYFQGTKKSNDTLLP